MARSRYGQLYGYGTFDITILAFAGGDFQLSPAQEAAIEYDESLPPLTDAVLLEAATQFRTQHGADIVGIKLCPNIEAFVVIFEGPEYKTYPTADGKGTVYPEYDESVTSRVEAWPEVFGNFHRGMMSEVQDYSFGDTWLQ